MNFNKVNSANFLCTLQEKSDAVAEIRGSKDFPLIRGCAKFYRTKCGVLVMIEVSGLPKHNQDCSSPIFALHIHSGSECKGNDEDPFADAMTHYNPHDCPHPYHAGDLPPLFGNNGYAFSVFLTDRFAIKEIIGRTVIIHTNPDDFTTQPSGNSGTKIACGVVTSYYNSSK